MTPVDRRTFLRGALSLGAGMAMTRTGGALAPRRTIAGTHLPARRSRAAGAGDLADLAAQLRGRLIVPGDPSYDRRRLVFDAAYDDVHPQAIALVADDGDVASVLRYAADRGVPLSTRSGGHSLIGASTGRGLVLDVSALDRVRVDTAAETVSIGAGARLIDVNARLRGTRRAIPSGSCPTVAIAGLTLGGGIGILTRRYGLTSDAVRAVDLVTAGGTTLHATETEHPELFWASRGGGGGSFAVVTGFELALFPIDFPFTRYEIEWPWAHRARAFDAWQEWGFDGGRNTTGTFTFSTAGPGARTPTIGVEGVILGPTDAARARLDDLQHRVGARPVERHVSVSSWFRTVKDEFCADVKLSECRLDTAIPPGTLPRFGLSVKSDFVFAPWPADSVAAISESIERRQADRLVTRRPASMNLGKVWFELTGDAAAAPAADATAFAHRGARAVAQLQSRWSADAPADVVSANLEWLRGVYAATAPWRSGAAYVNYPDPDLVDFGTAYFGANLPRLQAVKAAYDPTDLFHGPQSIPLPAA
jgi:FAD/FMN-containing dehydrogenase